MKLLGIDTTDVRLLGNFTFTNTTEFPVVVSLWQTSPLYYRVIQPRDTWSTDCGSVWFTIKVWLYNGENNINPGVKYSILAGNIVGFAAMGAAGLAVTAIAGSYGSSLRNPDWQEWLSYNNLIGKLSEEQEDLGVASIGQCEFSRAGQYAGKHPKLFISGGPIRRLFDSDAGEQLTLEWHEVRVDKCSFENHLTPIISPNLNLIKQRLKPASKVSEPYYDEKERYHDSPEYDSDAEISHQIGLLNYHDDEDDKESISSPPPTLPKRPVAGPARASIAPSSHTDSYIKYQDDLVDRVDSIQPSSISYEETVPKFADQSISGSAVPVERETEEEAPIKPKRPVKMA